MTVKRTCGAKLRGKIGPDGLPKLCKRAPVNGKKRCRLHGGAAGSGAQVGNKNRFKDGSSYWGVLSHELDFHQDLLEDRLAGLKMQMASLQVRLARLSRLQASVEDKLEQGIDDESALRTFEKIITESETTSSDGAVSGQKSTRVSLRKVDFVDAITRASAEITKLAKLIAEMETKLDNNSDSSEPVSIRVIVEDASKGNE